MRNCVSPVLAALILAATIAAPAAAEHGGIHPTFAPSTVYFHCTGETKVYQANWLLSLGAETSYTGWNATAPAESVQSGAGCGSLEPGWVSNELYDAVFQGSFFGNLRNLTVRIHELLVGQTREGTAQPMRIYAEVDGVPVFPGATPDAGYTGRGFTVTPTRVNSGATDLYEFSVTNLGYAIDILDEEGKIIDVETGGVAIEDGPGTQEHTFRLLIGADSFPGESPSPTGMDAWVWDTTEVPSGITFNPPALAASTVQADLPAI